MVQAALTPLDVQEFQFKLHCKLRIFNDHVKIGSQNANLVAVASKFGLIFVACPDSSFQVIKISDILNYNPKTGEVNNYPRRTIVLPSNATYITVNSDNTILAVVVIKDKCPVTFIYNVTSFFSSNVQIIKEVRLSSTEHVTVADMCWNPTVQYMFSVCLSDGCAHVYEIKSNGIEINSLEANTQATCMCWSPKGKQIVIGTKNGSLTQYKPDLKPVKTYPAPALGSNVCVICVVWITNYQFAAVFYNAGDSSSRPNLCIVNVPKNDPVSYINFDDICYSCGEFRPHQFYLLYQPTWSVILAASANSMEVGVLGAVQKEGSGIWQQWLQTDEARAELPLSSSKQETYPVGLAFDTASTHQLSWGENQTLQPMPLLHLLSHEGVLCIFNVINVRSDAATICSAPQPINDQTGLNNFCIPKIESQNQQNSPQVQINQSNNFTPVTSSDSFNGTQIPQPKLPAFQIPSTTLNSSMTSKFSTSNLPYNTEKGEPSFLLSSVITSTPTLPTNEKQQQKPQTINFFNSIAAPTTIKPSTTVNLNQQTSIQPSALFPVAIPATVAKQNINSSIQEHSYKPDISISEKQLQFDNSLVINLIKEVIIQFQTELTALQKKWQSVDIIVGSEEEKCTLALQSEALQTFFTDLEDTTVTQRAEIYALKQMLIEGFALEEEAVSRFRHITNPAYSKMFPSQELDPISTKHMSDIEHLLYYIDSQLKQVNDYLDNEWTDFQDSCKQSVKETLRIPTLEAIYQTMVRHYDILIRQNYLMKDIRARIKACNRKKGHLPLISNFSLNNTKMNLTSLESTMKKLHVTLQPEDVMKKKFEFIDNNQKQFTLNKEKKLRSLLTNNSKLIRICPKKPTQSNLSSSILLVTPAKLNKLPLAKPGGITSGTPIKTSTDEMKQHASSLNTSNTQLKPKKLSDYYEDITPPSTPNISEKDSQNDPNIVKWNENSFDINNKIFSPAQIPKASTAFNLPVCANNDNVFNKTQSVFSASKSTFSPVTSSIQKTTFIDSNKTENIENTNMPPEINSLNFGTTNMFANMQTSGNIQQLQTTQINYLKTGNSVSISPKPVNVKFTGFGPENKQVASNTFSFTPTAPLSTSFSSLGTSLSKPQPLITSNANQVKISTVSPKATNFSLESSLKSPVSVISSQLNSAINNPLIATQSSLLNENQPKPINILNNTDLSNILNEDTNTSKSLSLYPAAPLVSIAQTSKEENRLSTSIPPNILKIPTISSQQSLSKELTTSSVTFVTSSATSFSFKSPETAPNSSASAPTLEIGSLSVSAFTPKADASSTATSAGPFSFSLTTTSAPTTSASNQFKFGQNLFGNNTSVTTSANTFMGKPICSPSAFEQTKSTSTGSIFAPSAVTSSSSIFGQGPAVTTGGSIFGQTTSTSSPNSLFGQTVTTSTENIFGQTVKSTSPAGLVFGSQTITSTSSPSIFDKTTKSTSSSGSIFSQSVTTTAASESVFGQTVITSTNTAGSIFSQSATTSASTTGSIFGQPVTTSTPGSIFGQTVTTTESTGSIFGQAIGTSTTQGSIFGQTVASSSIFGQPVGSPTTVAGSIFGQTLSTTSNSSEIFGQSSPKPVGSIFGQPASSTGGNTMTIFGQAATNTSGSIFGQPTTTSTNSPAPMFGQTSTSAPGTLFGQPTTSASSTGNIFGQTPSSTSIFGSAPAANVSPFAKPATTGSSFIQPSNGNIFGAKPVFGQQPAFGQNAFGGSSTSGSIFGGNPTFVSNTSIFGASGTSAFGSTSNQSSVSNAFSGSGQSVNQVGFGSSTPFQKPASSAFGGTPAFGSSPAFGSAPVFGGSPAFGSPPKMFGAPQANAFGTPTQQNSTFANIANQNTVGFGNLAQNQNIPPQPQNTTQFSGGSFSNWR